MLSVLRVLALLTVYGISAGAGFAFLVVRTVMADLPSDLTRAFDYHPDRKTLVISSDGEEIGAFFTENRRVVSLARMPPHVPAAFIAAEDARFWDHPGYDVKASAARRGRTSPAAGSSRARRRSRSR